MNRPIKFRAWDVSNEQMVGWDQGVKQSPAHILEHSNGGMWKVMQFTGLTDKNGKEVYEGDVLQDYGEVIWITQSASFRVNPSRENRDISFTESFANIDAPEVIGNVYENPELLKV